MANINLKEVKFTEVLNDYINLFPKGAFLTTKQEDKINTMTMGWGNVGYIWGKNIIMVPVRKSRYTHQLIENSNYFTVSVPLNNQYQKELKFCGTKSGLNYDKIAELKLPLYKTELTDVPIISGNDLHFIAKIVYKQDMKLENLSQDYQNKNYPEADIHSFYYGEVIKVYQEA